MKATRTKYANTIYGFDIETTTIEEEITVHYLSCFEHCNLFKDNIKLDCFCRSISDVNNFLEYLNCFTIKTIICFCHNLPYEWDFLIKNVDFVKNNFDNDKALFLKSRVPLFIRLDYIEFRCSYKLLNKSIEFLGSELGFPKLEIDYKKRYFEFSELPPEEYKYNKRDVDIMLLAINKECSLWNWIKTVNDIPLTYTGFTRKNNRKINSRSDIHSFLGSNNFQKFLSDEEILFLENLYSGGFTHSNAYETFKIIKNVNSIDINSSYPFQMLYRKYPFNFKKITDVYSANSFFKRLEKVNKFDFFAGAVTEYYYYGLFRISKLKSKIENKNLIPTISFSKCYDFENVELDNGRVVSAEYIDIALTNIDIEVIKMFYDFSDIQVISNFAYTANLKETPNFIKKSVFEYLDKKNEIKQELKKNNSPELQYKYRKAKEQLNAQYGQNVEKIRHFDIKYLSDIDNFEIDTGDFDKVYYRNFIIGIYITAYARLELLYFAKLHINDFKFIYTDTDSWKFLGDVSKINDFNEKLKNVFNSKYDLGLFDFEGTSDYFITMGCKKYVTIKNNIVTATISGVPKVSTSKVLTECLEMLNYDLEQFQNLITSPNTIISGSITNKLASKYFHNEYFEKKVVDENGKSGIVSGFKMVTLVNIDYTLLNTQNYPNRKYLKFCEKLQNRQILDLYSIIEKRNNQLDLRFLEYHEFKAITNKYEIIDKSIELTVDDERND